MHTCTNTHTELDKILLLSLVYLFYTTTFDGCIIVTVGQMMSPSIAFFFFKSTYLSQAYKTLTTIRNSLFVIAVHVCLFLLVFWEVVLGTVQIFEKSGDAKQIRIWDMTPQIPLELTLSVM